MREAKRFDVVCSMEVVEHVDNPGAFLRSCAELVEVCLLSLTALHHPLFHLARRYIFLSTIVTDATLTSF